MPKKRVKSQVSQRNRIETTWKSLLVFLVLFIFSFILYNVSSADLFVNLFAMLSIIFAVVSFALVVILVVFWILKRR